MAGMRSVYLAQCLQVKNVALYISEMQRSFTDKLSKNFFNEPSQVCSRPCHVTLRRRLRDCTATHPLAGDFHCHWWSFMVATETAFLRRVALLEHRNPEMVAPQPWRVQLALYQPCT